jgi:hypothetical protein
MIHSPQRWSSVLIASLIFTISITNAVSNQAIARDLFVNNDSGSDSHSGLSAASVAGKQGPVRTIGKALQVAKKGDSIHIANTGVPYQESVSIQNGRNSGLVGKSFRILGNGATLDGRKKISYDQWTAVGNQIFAFKPPRTSFFILYIDNRPATQIDVPAGASKLPPLEELQWCLFKRKVYFKPANDRLPDTFDVSYTHAQVGITLVNCQHVVIENLIIQGFQLDGINVHDNVFGARLLEITSRGNGRSGISVGGASRVQIEACLLGNNGTAQLRTEGHSVTTLKNNDLMDTNPQAPAVVSDGGKIIR